MCRFNSLHSAALKFASWTAHLNLLIKLWIQSSTTLLDIIQEHSSWIYLIWKTNKAHIPTWCHHFNNLLIEWRNLVLVRTLMLLLLTTLIFVGQQEQHFCLMLLVTQMFKFLTLLFKIVLKLDQWNPLLVLTSATLCKRI